jgi:hypothetical protein
VGALTDYLTNNRVGAAVGNFLTEKALPFAVDVFTSPIGSVIKTADKVFEEGVREPLSGSFLQETYKTKGKPLTRNQAKQAAERISYGESLAYQAGQNPKVQIATVAANLFTNRFGNEQAKKNLDAVYDLLPMLNPNYNILDEKQRQEAQQSPLYQAVTGLTDIGLEVATSFGSGAAFKGLRKVSGLTRQPLAAKTIESLESEGLDAATDIQSQLDNGIDFLDIKPKNGVGVHILDILAKENPVDLLSNPVIARSHNPRLLSQLGAATQSVDEARDLVLAELGSVAAANRLATKAPSVADALNLSKKPVNLQSALPFEDIANPYELVDAAEATQLGGVLDDIIKRNPTLKGEWQDWYSKVSIGAGNVTWAPSKFSFVEQLNTLKTSIKTERLLGRGSNQIQENIIGGGAYRPFRILTLATTRLRPRGYIELTGLRPMDSIEEISATLQMSPILRKAKYKQFREDMINEWLAAPADEVARAAVIKNIENRAAKVIAKDIAEKLGLKNTDIDVDPAIARIVAKRDGIVEKIQNTDNGIVSKQTDGAEVTAVDENIKATLAGKIPMLDMRVVENVLREQIKGGSLIALRAKLNLMSVSADAFERAFSAAVLIRPGYIPKNSIFEPFVRVLGRIQDVTLPQIYGKNNFETRIIDVDDKGNLIVPLNATKNELTKQARQFDNFEDFSKAVSLGGLRPRVWHITKEPNFTPDVNFKPMNRLGGTSEEPVLFAGDPSFWKDYASGRKVVVEYDITNLQLNKDFYFDQSGNQGIYILPSAYSKLTKVKELSVDEAIKRAKKQQIEMPQNKNQAKAIWNKAKLNIAVSEPVYVTKQLDVTGADVIGGTALRQEIDPALTLANVTQPGVFERAPKKSFSTTPVNPTTSTVNKKLIKKYWGEYAKQIQILRNDPIVSRIMSGMSDNEIITYMLRDLSARGKFSDFYRVAAGASAGKVSKQLDLSEASARDILAKSRELVDNLIKDKNIQKQIVDSDELINAAKAQEIFKGKEVPTLDIDTDGILGLGVVEGYQRAINTGFRLIAKPESSLFRSPYGRYYGNEAVKMIVENARRNGIEITTDMWQNQIRPLAQEYALRQVEDTFYAIRRMNNVQYYSRFLLGFPTAMFNSIKYWVKAGFANPYNFALLEQIRTSPWAAGMVVDEEGNKITPQQADEENKTAYLVLPFFNKPGRVQPFLHKMNVNQLNFMVNGASPNWLGQVVLNTAVQRFPSLETTIKGAVGEKLYNQLIFGGVPRGVLPAAKDTEGKTSIGLVTSTLSNIGEQVFVAGSLKAAIDLAGLSLEYKFNKDGLQFRKDAFASALWSVHTARRVDWELNNPDGEEPSLDESIKLTYDVMAWRLVKKLFSPFSVTEQPVSIFYRDELDRMELNYVNNPQLLADRPGIQPYQAALQDYIVMYGEEAVRNLISGTKYKTSVAPEQEAARRLSSYEWLNQWVAKNPKQRIESVGMILNPVVPGDYSPAASAFLKISGVGGIPIFEGTKTFAEREADAQVEDGWREYDRITKQRDAYLAGRLSKSLTAGSNADIRAWYRDQIYNQEDGLIKRNAAWAETFGNMNDTFNENINLINVALDNQQWLSDIQKSGPEQSLWETVRLWRDGRDSIFAEWNTLPVNSPRRKQIRAQYEAFVFDLAQSNTYFADFANRYLVGDPIIDIKELLGE